MSWNRFLFLLRRWLFPGSLKRRKPIKRLPDRRKRVFHMDGLEDRSFMEPPVTSLVASAFGITVAAYALNVAVAEPARADYRVPTPAPVDTSPGIVVLGSPDFLVPENTGGGAVDPDYARKGAGAAYFAFDTGNALSDFPADALTGGLEPVISENATPLSGPLDAATATPDSGGGGAEPGGRSGPSGSAYAGSGSSNYAYSGSQTPGASWTPGGSDAGTSSSGFPGGLGLASPRSQPTISPADSPSGGSQPTANPVTGGQTITPSLLQNFARLPVYFEANQGLSPFPNSLSL